MAVLRLIDQLELGRLLDWYFGCLLAFEDTINVPRRAPVELDVVDPVRCKTAADNVIAERVHRGQLVARPERDDQIAIVRADRARK